MCISVHSTPDAASRERSTPASKNPKNLLRPTERLFSCVNTGVRTPDRVGSIFKSADTKICLAQSGAHTPVELARKERLAVSDPCRKLLYQSSTGVADPRVFYSPWVGFAGRELTRNKNSGPDVFSIIYVPTEVVP
jgi:hypothetical protein